MKKFKNQLELVRPFDGVIVILLLLGSFIPLIIFSQTTKDIDENSTIYAVVMIDGETVKEIELSENTPNETFTFYPADEQYNIIEVDGTKIRNKEDNSPDQIAVKTGWISKPGETAICLPHKLIIEVKATDSSNVPDDNVILPL
ncbi:NusG domain II-containing protein [Carnobacterium sp. ISL-102]|uniref:NusG domain II-containing protein n=1 Tax=Carnobacterium sp. ISL-102 TaxID=2819142 RepID=UPI001BE950F6|nr:NusG domain II-containing protein [Carnobacterium sp. ISL-102]MBT2732564.1 NusG domain II-containing protein [Carnobacterium sp. ISL-102]